MTCTIYILAPNSYIVRANSEYTVTWEEINQKLIDLLGGYLYVRYESDGIYIDYLEDFDRLNPQSIELGKNLLDLKTITKGEDIFTVLIPLGAILQEQTPDEPDPEIPVETVAEVEEPQQITEKRLTIESVNGGKDYIEDTEAIKRFGRITKVMTWDDVTLPENLLKKAKETLADGFSFDVSLEINAVDLSGTDKTISSFRIGTYNKFVTQLHELNETLLVKKLSITLDNPKNDKLTLGATFDGFLDQNNGNIGNIENDFNIKFEEGLSNVIINLEQRLSTIIQTTIDGIMTEVSKDYYLKGETDELIESIKTTFNQTFNEFTMTFEGFKQNLDDVIAGTDAEFEKWKRYIRFVDGKIVLGELGNELELIIQNDRISFMQGNLEVAYFSNAKLTVTDGEFINSLKLGKFGFVPRKNGNLSFRKLE